MKKNLSIIISIFVLLLSISCNLLENAKVDEKTGEKLTNPEINVRVESTDIKSGDTYYFESVAINSKVKRTVYIENNGNKDLTINGNILLDGENADQFSITLIDTTVIPLGERETFEVSFQPTSLGNKNANITINNDDPDESIYTFSLNGKGILENGNDSTSLVELTIVGNIKTSSFMSDVNIVGNYAFAVDYENRMLVIDISEPARPTIINSVELGYEEDQGVALSLHVVGSYAYLACSIAGLHIIDISLPTEPVVVGSIDTPGSAYNVYIAGSYAYVVDECLKPYTQPSQLIVIDVSDPSVPHIVGSLDIQGQTWRVHVSGSYAYVAIFQQGLQVVDITSPSNPTLAASLDLPSGAGGVYVSGDYAFVGGFASGLQVVDISVPSRPVLVGVGQTSNNAMGVCISGSYAFLATWESGLHVFDISDPTDPVLAGTADTPDFAIGIDVSGSHAYLANGQNGGLYIIDISNLKGYRDIGR